MHKICFSRANNVVSLQTQSLDISSMLKTSTQADGEAQISLARTPRLIMLGEIPAQDNTQHIMTLRVNSPIMHIKPISRLP